MSSHNYISFRTDSRHAYYLEYTSSDPYNQQLVRCYDDMLCQALSQIFYEHKQPKDIVMRSIWPLIWPLANYADGQMVELLRASELNFMVKRLLELEPGLIEIFPKDNQLPILWIAVLGCYQKSAELLVRAGAYVNEKCEIQLERYAPYKWTILQLVLKMYPSAWNERFIALLLDHDADLEARDHLGDTILHYAVSRCRVQETKLILKKGVDVNVTGAEGKTPLLTAASGKKADELVPLLLSYGADLTVRDNRGNNALHCLAFAPDVEHIDVAGSLIEKGVSLHDRDRLRRYQPIHWAVVCGKYELVKLFLDHGADVNSRATNDEFPLYLAFQYNTPTTLLTTLLKRGASINLKTTTGQTALHNACKHFKRNNVEKTEILLSVGADMFAEDRAGKTPFALIDLENVKTNEDILANPNVRLMIKTLALKKACQQPSIEVKDEGIIKQHPKLWNYYENCQTRITEAKFTKFSESCTFFELLTKDHCEIAERVPNTDFKSNLQLCDLNDYYMYAEDILRALEHARSHYPYAVFTLLPWNVARKVAENIVNCEECEIKKIVHAARSNGDDSN